MTEGDIDAVVAWLAAQPSLTGIPLLPRPFLPEDPDKAVTVREYDGPPTPNWQGDYRLLLRCRGAREAEGVGAYWDAKRLAIAVLAIVAPPGDRYVVIPLAGTHRARVKRQSGPLDLGADTQGRNEFTINISLGTTRV